MQLSTLAAAAIFAVLGATLPAIAQAPALPPTGPPPAPAAPDLHSVPGFLDPATGRFTPLMPGNAASEHPVSGTFTVLPDFRFDPDFGKDSTIFCTVTLTFGNVVNGYFYTNHTAAASVNFAAGDPDKLIAVPYDYTPNSPNAKLGLSISCFGYGDSGAYHSLTEYFPVEGLPDGDVTRTINTTF
jgi:hypothetical protein